MVIGNIGRYHHMHGETIRANLRLQHHQPVTQHHERDERQRAMLGERQLGKPYAADNFTQAFESDSGLPHQRKTESSEINHGIVYPEVHRQTDQERPNAHSAENREQCAHRTAALKFQPEEKMP